MDPQKTTSGNFIKSFQLIYYALIAGQLLFMFLTLVLIRFLGFDTEGQDLTRIFMLIIPVFVVAGIYSSNLIFKSRLNIAKGNSQLMDKLVVYRAASIIRYALLEGPSLLAIIIYLLTGSLFFIGLSGIIILFFFTIRPTKDKIVNDLELNPNESQALDSIE
jgi:hypothetical protein